MSWGVSAIDSAAMSGSRSATSYGQRLALVLVAVLAITLLAASSLYSRTGRGAAGVEMARLAYSQAVRVAAEVERTLAPDGKPTQATQQYLHRASRDLDASLVLFLQADTPLQTAHGPSLTKALARLREAEPSGTFDDSGQTPWIPRFDESTNDERFPPRDGRVVRVQTSWPYAIEAPVGSSMSLRLVPLALRPLSDGGYRSSLFVLFIVMALLASLAALRLARPLESAAVAMERMASTGGEWSVPAYGVREIGWIARAATRMRQRAVDAEVQQKALLRSLGRILVDPIGRVRTGLGTFSGARLSAARRTTLAEIEQDIGDLHRTVSALWQWNSLEAGSLEASLEATDLTRTLDEVVRLFVERRAPDLVVEVTRDDDVDEVVRMDARLFAGVFASILDNAQRHGEGPVSIHCQRAHTKVEIVVRDHGPGVPYDEVAMLFQPFRSMGDGSSGLGLGLRVARLVMGLHQGGLSARNHPDGGLELTLWLPAPPVRVSVVDKSLQSVDWATHEEAGPAAPSETITLQPPPEAVEEPEPEPPKPPEPDPLDDFEP